MASDTNMAPSDRILIGEFTPTTIYGHVTQGTDAAYYDADRDAKARDAFYGSLLARAGRMTPSAFGVAVRKLLRDKHTHQAAYNPAKYLFPRVDRWPDGSLRDMFSGRLAAPHDATLGADAVRIARASLPNAQSISAAFAARVPAIGYNCEHVVARSSFDDRAPMRGDLHHLFTCDSVLNLARGDAPFGEGDGRVCPPHGKGAIARAVLYFALRYPGHLRGYDRDALETMRNWHRADAVSLWERHRNTEIQKIQGNRNPLIDYPDWADKLDFI